jgi:hypothetical protein
MSFYSCGDNSCIERILLAEIQQNSNTTYGLMIMGVGRGWKTRALHLEKALVVADLGCKADAPQCGRTRKNRRYSVGGLQGVNILTWRK